MADYTEVDLANADKFAEANVQLRLLHKLHEVAPHLSSWLKVNVDDATSKDFRIPDTLKDSCKIVTIKITKTLCEMLSCMPMKETTNCDPNEKASYYYLYNENPSFKGPNSTFYDIQCQPSCFHTSFKPSYEDDNSRKADVPFLRWNNDICHILNLPVINWLEKPRYRADIMYEMRVNDLKMGFTRYSSPDTVSGISYKMNAAYCEVFDSYFNDKLEKCEDTWGDVLSDVAIGTSIINFVKSTHRIVTSRERLPFKLPDLPNLPTTFDPIYTLEGWKKNIFKDFKLEPLIDTTPKLPKRNDDQMMWDDENNMSIPTQTHLNQISKERKTIPKKDWVDSLNQVLISVLRAFTKKETYRNISIDYAMKKLLEKVEIWAINIIKSCSAFLIRNLIGITKTIGQRVLLSGIKGMVVRIVAGTMLQLGSKLVIYTGKILKAVKSIMGFLLLLTFVLDFILGIWDPYSYSNPFPSNLPNDLMHKGELALRQSTGLATPSYTFIELANTVLGTEVVMESFQHSVIDRIQYLNALTKNSEGSLLDKGNLLECSEALNEKLEEARNDILAEHVKFTPEKFATYNERFMERYRINKYMNYTSAISIIVSGTFLLLNLPLLSIVCILLSVIVLALSRLQLQNDFLVDITEYCKDKNLSLHTV